MIKEMYPGKNYKFIQEYDTGYYISDLYIEELGLVVEIDGISHYQGSVNTLNAKSRTKRAVLKKLGYKYANINLKIIMSKNDH
jgi:very-short-patch-repair endonuclease